MNGAGLTQAGTRGRSIAGRRSGPSEHLVSSDSCVVIELRDPVGAKLSNLHPAQFVLDGVTLASVEGFIQGIKFQPGDANRERAFGLSGYEAKLAGRSASDAISASREAGENSAVYWGGDKIAFGSRQHLALIERAIRAKFEQNPAMLKALAETGDAVLIHPIQDTPHTSLRASDFVDILVAMRAEALQLGCAA